MRGLRFHRTIRVAPGFKVNLSKSGISFSAHIPGVKGLSVSTGAHGTYVNTGLPGTGLSKRTKLSDKGIGTSFKKGAHVKKEGQDSEKKLADASDKQQFPDQIEMSLEEMLKPYTMLHTKAPSVCPATESSASTEETEVSVEQFLKDQQLPYVFNASFEYQTDQNMLLLDVDLPEIEEIPDEEAETTETGHVAMHAVPAREVYAHYAQALFSLATYLSASLFNRIPSCSTIVLSGYTQRRNKAGDLNDVYILSIQFVRDKFLKVKWNNIDPEDFCMRFENRVNRSSTGYFKKIQPYYTTHSGKERDAHA